MCRHAAAIGPGLCLTDLTHAPSHGLVHQSYAARELLTGVVCADGFGVAWYDDETRPEPARYASPMPIWSDTNLASFGPITHSPLVMAAVRNATIAGTTAIENCAPFVEGRYCFSLNGYLEDQQAWAVDLQDLAGARARRIKGATDAEAIFQAVLARHESGPDDEAGLAEALKGVVQDLLDRSRTNGLLAQLNILMADGKHVYATRAGSQEATNSLYHIEDPDELPGHHVVASEPLWDEATWAPVEPGHLLVLTADAPPVRLRI